MVVAVGPGARNSTTGAHIPMSVAVGDKVMLPEYGGSKIELEDKEYTLLREADIVAKLGYQGLNNGGVHLGCFPPITIC